ncbi:MAG TPA: phosphoglucosamine mutase [Blastocatellia bacterium]
MAKRLFGTDGIRGVAGEFPLDLQTVERIGRSLTLNLTGEALRPPKIIIGRDTRESGPAIESALAKGAAGAGAEVESAGVITTPGVAFLARTGGFDAGVVISASHNPFLDNGIKVFSPSGQKMADAMERKIERDLDGGSSPEGGKFGPAEKAGRDDALSSPVFSELAEGELRDDARYEDRYVEFLVRNVGARLSLSGVRLGLDCANGAAYRVAPRVFAELGAEVEVISVEPDGRNINEGCGSLHPELLIELVTHKKLDVGIGFDGDADRSLFVDAPGELVDGDHTMLIVAEYLQSIGQLKSNSVVTTVMSNMGLEVALRERGIKLVRTNVGDRFVLEEMLAQGIEFGGEQSGHMIFSGISLAGDGIITAIELLRAVGASGKTLHDLASKLMKYPQVLINFNVRSKPPLETLPAVSALMHEIERDMAGRGRLLVRYSGTENVARVMVEGEDRAATRRHAERLAEVIKSEIGETAQA